MTYEQKNPKSLCGKNRVTSNIGRNVRGNPKIFHGAKTPEETRKWLEELVGEIIEEYVFEHTLVNAEKDIQDRGYIRPYLRMRESDGCRSMEICWLKMRWAPTKKNKKRMLSDYIRKGKGFHYPMKSFRGHAKSWEMPMIMKAEEVFALVREQNRELAQIARRMHWLNERNKKIAEHLRGGQTDEEGT